MPKIQWSIVLGDFAAENIGVESQHGLKITHPNHHVIDPQQGNWRSFSHALALAGSTARSLDSIDCTWIRCNAGDD